MISKANSYMNRDIKNILEKGYYDENPRPKYKDGTPAHTYFVTHNVRQYDLSKNEFPICTLRPIAWKSAIKEIFWIYQKKSDSLDMLRNEFGIKYWDEWESKNRPGTINSYGSIINKYNLFNKRVLDDIKENPYGRYHVCSMWQEEVFNEKDFDGLKPCCYETIWTVRGEYLDMFLNQRSGDMLTASGAGGVNEVQYAALLMMVARHTGYKPGKFTHFIANEQIYDRHIEQAKELQNRYECMVNDEYFHDVEYKIPCLKLNENVTNFYEMSINDFEMINYQPKKPQISLELGI